jgi:hypothetical protein
MSEMTPNHHPFALLTFAITPLRTNSIITVSSSDPFLCRGRHKLHIPAKATSVKIGTPLLPLATTTSGLCNPPAS